MKRALLPALLLLAACGNPQGEVQLIGSTPLRPQEKDLRGARGYCGSCGKTVEYDAQKCSGKKCGAILAWKDTVDCSFCGGTGDCKACNLLGQKDQKCFNCNGEGILVFQGRSANCGQCGGKGTCRICTENPGKCDACDGTRKLTQDRIREYAAAKNTNPDPDSE